MLSLVAAFSREALVQISLVIQVNRRSIKVLAVAALVDMVLVVDSAAVNSVNLVKVMPSEVRLNLVVFYVKTEQIKMKNVFNSSIEYSGGFQTHSGGIGFRADDGNNIGNPAPGYAAAAVPRALPCPKNILISCTPVAAAVPCVPPAPYKY